MSDSRSGPSTGISQQSPVEQVSVPELVNAGVAHYRDKNFKQAIQILHEALDREPKHWRAKLYLGMSYFHCQDLLMAQSQFRFLRANCPDSEILMKVDSAMAAMNHQVNSRMPEMTCQMRKLVIKEPPPPQDTRQELQDDKEVGWID